MKNKGFFSLVDLGNLIAEVETLINKKDPPVNEFILLHKKSRFLNLNSLKKSIAKKWDPGNRDAHLRLRPTTVRNAFRMLSQSVSSKVEFPTSADIIIKSSNVNLFYFDKGVRVRIYMPNGIRTLSEFQNEFSIRKKVEASGLLLVPKLLDGHLKSEPYFFVDEIVFGDLLTWKHPEAKAVYREIIPKIWNFYQSNGIVWSTLQEKGINIHDMVEDYESPMYGSSNYMFDSNLDNIKGFDEKLIPCSLIHGDLAIDNIIITSKGNYIIDWELSKQDFIIYDFYRILMIKEWDLHEDIERLMRAEIEECFGTNKTSALSLSEQLLLALFLVAYNAYKFPLSSSKLRSDTERHIKQFFNAT